MQTIKYEDIMIDILNNINTKKKMLQKLLKNNNSKKFLNEWLQLELAYTSNAIEGNTLTRKETAIVIDEKRTSSSKPLVFYQEAVNHANAYNKIIELVEQDSEISENDIFNIHRIILSGIDNDNAGFYRNCRVSIRGSRVVLPNPLKVPNLMAEFFDWLKNADKNSPLTAIEAHYRFVKIHPFVDGNGRCARLLMNLLLLKAGYSPIIIRTIDRKRYIDNIEKYQLTDDSTSYTMFMLMSLDRSLRMCIDTIKIDETDIDYDKLLNISQFAKLVNLPVSTIRYWVKVGKLQPVQYSDAGYMKFSKLQVAEVRKIPNKH